MAISASVSLPRKLRALVVRKATPSYIAVSNTMWTVPKTKIEVAVDASQVEQVIETINSVARTGKIGDGKVFVYELGDAIRIRTGESGIGAL